MADRSPLVSVCIPTRDRAHWLGEALDSVFAQTLEDFELIVFDDASTDATEEVLRARPDPRLRTYRHQSPVGVAANRNACLRVARGRYVAWLDSDDGYLPRMLELQSARLEADPAVALAHGGCHIVDEGGDRLPDWPPPFPDDVVESGADAFRELVLQNYIVAPTVLVRREAHERAGPYRVSLRSGEDWEMWLRIALRGDLAYTAEPVARYRWHPKSLTRSADAAGRHLTRDPGIVDGVFEREGHRIAGAHVLRTRARAAIAARGLLRATDLVLRGRRSAARRALSLARRAHPGIARDAEAWRRLRAATADDYRWHVESRRCLRGLLDRLDGSRFADSLRSRALTSVEWEATLERIARTVREVVPPGDAVAVVDKWDPTLLHLSRRRGWHFPDRRTMPDGYPEDSGDAIRHLEELRARGARHLVLPCSAFWWLEFYGGLARHLESSCERLWRDEGCIIYRLDRGSSCAA